METPIRFILNDRTMETRLPAGMVLLDFIRQDQQLMGTKIGCREGDCGACTVLVGEPDGKRLRYQSMTSCLMPLGNASGKHIVTIEGLNREGLTPIQRAVVDQGATQCGFCTVGFVVSLAGFCLDGGPANLAAAVAAMDGNICRCTGYKSLERAAVAIANQLGGRDAEDIPGWLVQRGFLPDYFPAVFQRLIRLRDRIREETAPVDAAQVVGGGTDLFVQRPEEMAERPIQLVFDRPDFKGICLEGGRCVIGACATAEDLRASPLIAKMLPHIRDYMKLVSSTPIRNMGTLVGNLVNASPIGDLTIFFLALGSEILLIRGKEKRNLALEDFYLGYKQLDKAEDELVSAISFPAPGPNTHFNFEKICKRTHLDIASVNSALRVEMENGVIVEAGLSAGGVAPIPLFLREASAYLVGKKPDDRTVREAAAIALKEISPISDARGSAEYKRLLLRQLIYAHFLTCFPRSLVSEALV